jgi:hypothetical protein
MAKGKCSKCGADSEDKTNLYCKECRQAYQREYYRNNPRKKKVAEKPAEVKPEPITVAGAGKCGYCGHEHTKLSDVVCGEGRTKSSFYTKELSPMDAVTEGLVPRTPQYNFPVVEIGPPDPVFIKEFITPTGAELGNPLLEEIAFIGRKFNNNWPLRKKKTA